MSVKLLGAIFIVGGCGSFGFSMAAAHRREEKLFRQYLIALEFMECELRCRLTPLPELCRGAAQLVCGTVRSLFLALLEELEAQMLPDARICAGAAAASVGNLPDSLRFQFLELGQTLGRFDLEGQLSGLESNKIRARQVLNRLEENRSARLRSYQTLGLCAGAALAILFI